MDFKKFSKLVLIEQTFFALPFAYLGVLFAGGGTVLTWVWVTLAMIGARTAGMSFNRLIDADIDAKNPRTSDRLLPRGEVTRTQVWTVALLSSALLVFSSFMLNELCFYLSFAAIALLFSYSWFKHFSATSHFYLGFVEAAAPIGGYLAVTGEFHFVPFVLGFAIMTWIGGLDIVYALQDKDFDSEAGLYSIPAKFGESGALLFSAGAYVLASAALITAGILTTRGTAYWVAAGCVMLIFFHQQRLARNDDLSASVREFFRVNMFISPVLFLGTFIDVLWM